MPDTFDTPLLIRNQEEGGNDNTWGENQDRTNRIIVESVAGYLEVTVTGNLSLTLNNDTEDENGRKATLKFIGTPVADATITLPDRQKLWHLINTTGKTLTFTAGAGTNVVVPDDHVAICHADGATNAVEMLMLPLRELGMLMLESAVPQLRLKETDGSPDENWTVEMSAGDLVFKTADDDFIVRPTRVTFSKTGTVTVPAGLIGDFVQAEAAAPQLRLKETDGAADENWAFEVVNGDLLARTANDAYSVFTTRVTFSKTGGMSVPGGVTANLTGNVTGDLTGSVTAGAGETIDVSAGTLALADNQILFPKLEKFPAFSTTKWDQLRVNSGGAALEFYGPKWIDLGEFSGASVASVDLTWAAGDNFDAIAIYIEELQAVSSLVNLNMRVLEGGTPDAGAVYAWWRGEHNLQAGSVSNVYSGGSTGFTTAVTLMGTTHNGAGVQGKVELVRTNDIGRKFVEWGATSMNTSGAGIPFAAKGVGHMNNGAAIDGVRFYFASGNISSYVLHLFGMR